MKNGKPKLLWKSLKLAHWWYIPVLRKGRSYAIDQGPGAEGHKAGALYCYEMETGKLHWFTYQIGGQSRSSRTKGGKLLMLDGKLFLLNDYGSLIIAKSTEKGPEPIVSFQAILFPDRIWSMPVLANRRLYCRDGRGKLACYDLRKE